MTDEAPSQEPGQVQAAPGSPLANLRERRTAIAKSQVLDLPVPRWDEPTLVVRYKPGDHPYFRRQMERIDKAERKKKGEVEVEANSDVLIHCAVGVFAIVNGKPHVCTEPDVWRPIDTDDDGQIPDDYEFDGPPFSPELGATLGAETPSARGVVTALFFTDGDLLGHSGEVMRWSGYRETEADGAILGE